MRITIVFWLLVLCATASAVMLPGKVYTVDMQYDSTTLVRAEVNVGSGFVPDRALAPTTGYKMVLYDGRNAILSSYVFQRSSQGEVFDSQGNPKGYIPIRGKAVYEVMPYYTEGATIKILDPSGAELQAVDVTSYRSCDQNSKCECRETAENCPVDCPSGQMGVIAKQLKGITVTDLEKKQDCGLRPCKEGYERKGDACVEAGCDMSGGSGFITPLGFLTQSCFFEPLCLAVCPKNAVLANTLATSKTLFIGSILAHVPALRLGQIGARLR